MIKKRNIILNNVPFLFYPLNIQDETFFRSLYSLMD
jgi:hypothetical protein